MPQEARHCLKSLTYVWAHTAEELVQILVRRLLKVTHQGHMTYIRLKFPVTVLVTIHLR